MFAINQIVKGHKAGTFVILGFRTMPGETEQYAQLKPIDAVTQRPLRGELALPLTALVAA